MNDGATKNAEENYARRIVFQMHGSFIIVRTLSDYPCQKGQGR
jgi:hypothetical protein